MKSIALGFALLVSPLAFAQNAASGPTTGYENRPLPTVSADLTAPAAPAKSATCVVPEQKSWAEVSVSRLALEAQGTCAAPLKETAGKVDSAPILRK